MRYARPLLVLGALGVVYGIGYVRGQIAARIGFWCDKRAQQKLK